MDSQLQTAAYANKTPSPYTPVDSSFGHGIVSQYGKNAPTNPNGLDYGKYTQGQGSNSSQRATNVLDVRNNLSGLLSGYQQNAADYLNQFTNAANSMPTVNLGNNFQGSDALNSALHGGIDYFGQQGISQGLANINAQRNAQNAQLASTLGRNAGNNSLISVLQNQNQLQSQLAGIPLISEAQQGTYGRALSGIDVNNQYQNLLNNAQLQNAGFNLQSKMGSLGALQQGLQPTQNLLDTLTNLQGQQRGVASTETQVGSKNFK